MLIATQSIVLAQKESNSSCSSSAPSSSYALMQGIEEAHDPTSPPTTRQHQAMSRPTTEYSLVDEEKQHQPLYIPSSKLEASTVVPITSSYNICSPAVVQIAPRLPLRKSEAESINKYNISSVPISPRCSSTTHFAFAGTTMEGQVPHNITTSPTRPPPTTHVFFPMDRASPQPAATSQFQPSHQPLHWNITSNSTTSSPRSVGTARAMMQPIHNHGPRTPPEVLKTLLRKKACLYEPGTSYAIAIVTWLVGRSLTVTCGYFSRQQLQYGVHQAVAEIIDSGNITRTKVNRCMQIILNSCFHYVIPHPKTDDVSSRRFRDKFSSSLATNDDSYYLLQSLDHPWDDLDLDGAMKKLMTQVGDEQSIGVYSIEEEENEEVSTKEQQAVMKQQRREGECSPKLSSISRRETGMHDHSADVDGEDGSCSNKRAVLLCFNESVMSFENVWRCHNEFIRDVARAGNLKLTAQEWKEFFTRDILSFRTPCGRASVGSSSAFADTSSEEGSYSQRGASLSPRLPPLHPSPAISQQNRAEPPDFFLDGRQPSHQSYAAAAASRPHAVEGANSNTELDQRFAVMDENELSRFRTQWCTKRYDHDPRVCSFAHTKINQGWLRRNPSTHNYKDEFCPNILMILRPGHFLDGCSFNQCPDGVHCQFCHSQEEMEYHPNRYKQQRQTCPVFTKVSKDGGDLFDSCDRDHTCPYVHPITKSHSSTRGVAMFGRSSTNESSTTGTSGGIRYGTSGSHSASRTLQHHPRSPRSQGKSGQQSDVPLGEIISPVRSPMMYISPAPESNYEMSLTLPGLKSIFRQHCAVLYSYLSGGAADRTSEQHQQGDTCRYQYFGDLSPK
mmetsp:Transcript_27464/g.39318  ORF Transcript_27464/g.39318 Transcript_27464/m.39318 type:complete len:843 (+) Transcript_27464:106-2634(+)